MKMDVDVFHNDLFFSLLIPFFLRENILALVCALKDSRQTKVLFYFSLYFSKILISFYHNFDENEIRLHSYIYILFKMNIKKC